jgi:HEAT repeat protein
VSNRTGIAESTQPLSIDELRTAVETEAGSAVARWLERFDAADPKARKDVISDLRRHADAEPDAAAPVAPSLAPILADDERSVRLQLAKLYVAVAEAVPASLVPIVPELAARLADEDEFYYVRARCAEALGYIAVECPGEATSPAVLADLRLGLEFDEPEVKRKLAKALSYVAIGDPTRLRHLVGRLADQRDDEDGLVRYHLATALVVVGCEFPAKLAAGREALEARLNDENHYVRGRAAEALGLLVRTDRDEVSLPESTLMSLLEADESFVVKRAQFALAASNHEVGTGRDEEIGDVAAIRRMTADIVDDITAPAGDHECPQCGLALPESGPPMCPRCGAPF